MHMTIRNRLDNNVNKLVIIRVLKTNVLSFKYLINSSSAVFLRNVEGI